MTELEYEPKLEDERYVSRFSLWCWCVRRIKQIRAGVLKADGAIVEEWVDERVH